MTFMDFDEFYVTLPIITNYSINIKPTKHKDLAITLLFGKSLISWGAVTQFVKDSVMNHWLRTLIWFWWKFISECHFLQCITTQSRYVQTSNTSERVPIHFADHIAPSIIIMTHFWRIEPRISFKAWTTRMELYIPRILLHSGLGNQNFYLELTGVRSSLFVPSQSEFTVKTVTDVI